MTGGPTAQRFAYTVEDHGPGRHRQDVHSKLPTTIDRPGSAHSLDLSLTSAAGPPGTRARTALPPRQRQQFRIEEVEQ